MTTKEKAKRYDEALERARKCLDEKRDTCFVRPDAIFPELKESEDERIRKAIIRLVEINKESMINNVTSDSMLTWLEKQGQSFPILSNSSKTVKDWTEEDAKAIDNCCLLIAAADNSYEKAFKDDCIHYLQNLKQRMEQ